MIMDKNHPKNQHYVPQFLLRNFTIGKKKRVYVFDKLLGKSFQTSTRNIAAESGFYDYERDGKQYSLEPFMGQMEAEASGVIKRVIKQQSLAQLNNNDRVSLSLFAAIQQLRVKSVRHRINSMNSGLRRVLTERGFTCEDVLPEMNEDDVKQMSIEHIQMAKEFSKHFYDKAWLLQRAPKSKLLYTSDNPITLHNLVEQPGRGNLGLTSPGIEIYLPISKHFSICFLCDSMKQAIDQGVQNADSIQQLLGYYPMDITPLQRIDHVIKTGKPDSLHPENVTHQNSLQVLYSSRFIYSATNDFELVKSMITENPQIKHPPEITFR